jgi:four helix bundle protein
MTSSNRQPSPLRGHRDLIVWQRAMQLLVECYRVAKLLPASERYTMTSQFLRAAISVPANIAEGHGRMSKGDFARHLTIARGSLAELDTLLAAIPQVGLLPDARLARACSLADEVGRMLWSLIQKLGTRRIKP